MPEVRAHPVFLRLGGRRVLLVGGGPVASEKAVALVAAGARVRVVAPEIRPELEELADSFARRPFAPEDVNDAWFIVAAAPPAVNHQVRIAADRRQRFVIAVDDVANCSAIGAAVLQQGPLTLAISSDGEAPALVGLLRQALEVLLPPFHELEAWIDLARQERARWKAEQTPFVRRRPSLLAALEGLYVEPAPAPGDLDAPRPQQLPREDRGDRA